VLRCKFDFDGVEDVFVMIVCLMIPCDLAKTVFPGKTFELSHTRLFDKGRIVTCTETLPDG
jgi:hypothetical protein